MGLDADADSISVQHNFDMDPVCALWLQALPTWAARSPAAGETSLCCTMHELMVMAALLKWVLRKMGWWVCWSQERKLSPQKSSWILGLDSQMN